MGTKNLRIFIFVDTYNLSSTENGGYSKRIAGTQNFGYLDSRYSELECTYKLRVCKNIDTQKFVGIQKCGYSIIVGIQICGYLKFLLILKIGVPSSVGI